MTTQRTPSELAREAARLLLEGKLVAIPTETVYGLAADATNEDAVRKIFEVKGRPSNNPLILHFDSLSSALPYIDLGEGGDQVRTLEYLNKLAAEFWPGPLSIVVRRGAGVADSVCAGGNTIAIRVPNHPVTLAILQELKRPVAAPSANPSSYISPTVASHVRESLGNLIDLVVDGGACSVGVESTVLNLLSDPIQILRPGFISAEQITQTLGCNVESIVAANNPVNTGDTLLSPGMLSKHYSPTTPVVLLPHISKNLNGITQKVGVILFDQKKVTFECADQTVLSQSGDLLEIAAKLFSALRELDKKGLDLIVVDTCEPKGLGLAIMDRLIRASAR